MPTRFKKMTFYSTSEVAQRIQVTAVSVRNYIRQGHLRAHKTADRYIILKDDLNIFLKNMDKNK